MENNLLSLYIHIPFCAQKCAYCSFASFFVNPEIKEHLIGQYLQTLEQEIRHYGAIMWRQQIKSLYLWWGTPNILTPEQLFTIVWWIDEVFDLKDIVELSIEMNPYPTDEIYDLIRKFHTHFKWCPRLRFSFGIQTFDNTILKDVGRPVSFAGLTDFLRWLRDLKLENMVFNLDFIAFGKFNQTRKWDLQLRDPVKLEFFNQLAESHFADSFSLYTMELFAGSAWQSKTPEKPISGAYYGDDDAIYEEFDVLKGMILDAGYSRYELSNFSRPGKSSIHNRVYREMEDYLGLWMSASSFIKVKGNKDFIEQMPGYTKDCVGLRWTNTANLTEYMKWNYIDSSKNLAMTPKDFLIESFFLKLRTDLWVTKLEDYSSVLVADRKERIESYKDQGFAYDTEDRLVLTDAGMDVFNTITTDLLHEI